MAFDPVKHHRRSIRLKGQDYSQAGTYFVTVCLQSREGLFGQVTEGQMRANDAGQMVDRWWHELTRKYPHVTLGDCVVMPNHLHGIVVITRPPDARAGPPPACGQEGGHIGPPRRDARRGRPTLGDMMDWFKTMTTNEYIRGVKGLGWPRFRRKLWQRDYYESILRTDADLCRVREYIAMNPAQWAWDRQNPNARWGRGRDRRPEP